MAIDDSMRVPGMRPGTVFIGLATRDGASAERIQLPDDRARIREFSVISALNLLGCRSLTGLILLEFFGSWVA